MAQKDAKRPLEKTPEKQKDPIIVTNKYILRKKKKKKKKIAKRPHLVTN